MEQKKIRNEKGITLIALTVTIIVLLILTGITIVSLEGENGILNKALSTKSQAEEKVKIEGSNEEGFWVSVLPDEETGYYIDINSKVEEGNYNIKRETKQTLTIDPNVPGTIFYHKFIAKITKGYYANIGTNLTGIGTQYYWITDYQGTGEWEEYIYAQPTGYNGSFSSMGYVYLLGGNREDTIWYLQESTVYRRGTNLSELQSTNIEYKFKESDATLQAAWGYSGSRVTYDKQGGTFGNGTVGNNWTATAKDFVFNTAYTATKTVPYYISDSDFAIYKDGYTLDGWYTQAEGGTKLFDANGQLIPSVEGYSDAERKWLFYDSNIKIYAHWIPNS